MKDNIFVFDLEANGLNPSKIYCVVISTMRDDEWVQMTMTDYDDMKKFFSRDDLILVGHNIIRWDIPVIERLLDLKVKAKLVDTLALSWTIYPKRVKHGLTDWGVDFGIPKPKIDDWENQTIEEYIYRCQEDVKINISLWEKQIKNLNNLYEGSTKSYWKYIDYIMFKMDTARVAEESKWKLDVGKCQNALSNLQAEKEVKLAELRDAMPKIPVKSKVRYPLKPYKKNRCLSSTGIKWFNLLKEKGYDSNYKGVVEYTKSYTEPNPNSVPQIKSWLISIGWKPINFNYVDDRKVPQIRIDNNGEKVLCPSVVELISKEPSIKYLEGLTVLTHRIGILKGYMKNVDEEGYLQAKVSGLTNTLRFKHSVIVNLPSIHKPYGDIVRGVLIAPEGYELCGSDMSSLEDRTKQHYMWDFDPDYVKEMQTPDFDPHLALAEFAGALTTEQVKAHKEKKENHSITRHLYKTANYSCTYGAGGEKLSQSLKVPVSQGRSIVDAYRKKNWSIDAIANSVKTKECLGEMWLYNPVSEFWYSLRHKKDRFSTLNQGTGVYCFDVWIYFFMKNRPQITGQMHDEVILCVKKGYRQQCEKLLRDAIDKTNKSVKLNRELDIDVQFGNTYAEIH